MVDRLVIDCSGATHADSTFITAILRYRRAFVDAGRDPFDIVVIASEPIRRIFDIAGVSRALTVVTAKQSSPLSP